MKTSVSICLLFLLVMFLVAGVCCATAEDRYRVLVVQSYEDDYLWEVEVRQGLEKSLGEKADLTFFYMNTKTDLAGGHKRASQAYDLFQSLQPDGVVAVDDNAQSMFVVPYLKNKTDIPVIFCGVNEEPEAYGYPAKNVTGVLERYHFEETLALTRQLAGKAERFSVMVNKSPLAGMIVHQLEKVRGDLSAELTSILQPETLTEAVSMANDVKADADLLLIVTLKGIRDDQGVPVSDARAITSVVEAFDKPTAGTASFVVRNGALSAVLASGQEQGWKASDMLLQAMSGTPVSALPITRNYFGKRVINVSTMRALGLTPGAMALRGIEFVGGE